jgi:hypothetical protein
MSSVNLISIYLRSLQTCILIAQTRRLLTGKNMEMLFWFQTPSDLCLSPLHGRPGGPNPSCPLPLRLARSCRPSEPPEAHASRNNSGGVAFSSTSWVVRVGRGPNHLRSLLARVSYYSGDTDLGCFGGIWWLRVQGACAQKWRRPHCVMLGRRQSGTARVSTEGARCP